MQRSRTIRLIITLLSSLLALLVIAGCSRHAQNAALPPAAPAPQVQQQAAIPKDGQPTAFQPYTLLPSPPPAPTVITHRHQVLHLTRLGHRVYLADSDRHLYEAGRDAQGHVYPVYRDPVTQAAYPLYYDSSRDDLYRVARNDDGRFYRNYVGQPTDRFYAMEQDPEHFSPSDNDRPVVTDSYNTYNYNTYNYGNTYSGYHAQPYYAGYRPPPAHHAGHHNNDWLWAIPVIVGVYFLLQPHHHHFAPPRPANPTTIIVRQITPVTIINQYAPPAVSYAVPRHPVVYHPLAVHNAHFVPVARPANPISPRHRGWVPPVMAAPLVHPHHNYRRIPIAKHPGRTLTFRRPAVLLARHPFLRHAAPSAMIVVRPRPSVHRPVTARVVRAPQPPRFRERPLMVRPKREQPAVARPRTESIKPGDADVRPQTVRQPKTREIHAEQHRAEMKKPAKPKIMVKPVQPERRGFIATPNVSARKQPRPKASRGQ